MRGIAKPLALVTALTLAFYGAGCGEDEDPARTSTVTVTETTGPTGAQESTGATDPNDPKEGTDPYDVYGNTWGRLPLGKQIAAARAFIADNPERCPNAGAEDVVSHVNEAYGSDYPLATLASRIMGDTCDLAATGD